MSLPTIVTSDVDTPLDTANGSLSVAGVSIGDLIMVLCGDADDGSGTPEFTAPTDDDSNTYTEIGTKTGVASSGPYTQSFATRATASGTVAIDVAHTNEGGSVCSVVALVLGNVFGSTVGDCVVASGGNSVSSGTSLAVPSSALTITDDDCLLVANVRTNAVSREIQGVTDASPPTWSTTPANIADIIAKDGNDADNTGTWMAGVIYGEQATAANNQITVNEDLGDSWRAAGQLFAVKGAAAASGHGPLAGEGTLVSEGTVAGGSILVAG